MATLKPLDDLACKTVDRCMSLTLVIQANAGDRPEPIDLDDLHACLGLSLLVCASESEPNVGMWPLLARDLFLEESCHVFGINTRALHPPESAVGLEKAEEFEQHFDASYRPLIHRALENRQAVIAWRAWSGQFENTWGTIDGSHDEGAGFVGTPHPAASPSHRQLVCDRPPTQVYTIESVSPQQPKASELFELTVAHAQAGLRGDMPTQMGITTGPSAFDVWLDKLTGLTEPPDPSHSVAHSRLAKSLIAGHQSAARFFRRSCEGESPAFRSQCETIAASCDSLTHTLSPVADPDSVQAMIVTESGRKEIGRFIHEAQQASEKVLSIL